MVCLIQTDYKKEFIDIFTKLAKNKILYSVTLYSDQFTFPIELYYFYDLLILVANDNLGLSKEQLEALVRGNTIKLNNLESTEVEFTRTTPIIILTSLSSPNWLDDILYTRFDEKRALLTLSNITLLKFSIEEIDILNFWEFFIKKDTFTTILYQQAFFIYIDLVKEGHENLLIE